MLKIWDLYTGKELHRLEGHTNLITSIKVTLNGRFLIPTSDGCTLKVWKLSSANLFVSFNADKPLLTCASTGDGKTIVAGGWFR
jgi:WD40 repeat protein